MEDENDLDSIPVICPACGDERAIYLGRLGVLAWFRCRACGMDYSLQEFETPEEKEARLADDQVVEEAEGD